MNIKVNMHIKAVNTPLTFVQHPRELILSYNTPASSPDNSQIIAHKGVLPSTVIGIVLMVHQPFKPPLRQTLEAYNSGLIPALSSTPPAIKS